MWVEADHSRDFEDAEGVGKAHDFSSDTMMVLFWITMSLELFPVVSLSRGADREQRQVQMWRDVVKLLIEPNAED